MTNEELVLSYQQGDKQALDILIDSNIGIVRKIAKKYNTLDKLLELDDLIQSGILGLITAANKYDLNIENKATFITYAFQYIEREIYNCANGRGSREVNNNKFYRTVNSLNVPVGEEEDTELINMLDSHDMSMENIEDEIYFKQLRNELEGAMIKHNTLLERQILKLYYGWDIEPIKIKEIGEMFSVPEDKARLMEVKALRKIKDSLWGRTSGRKYRDELIGTYDNTYRAVEKRIDLERYFKDVI
ncbi:RNA polymerase sigma factor (sigma-70 family) [Clostridium saccharoperbutylacetonicum]|uniref:RNA polymerase sigma factor, sigma-70 family n=1 Tax=Clostridium saccharoperbutylacetonicum N1-4(HMT) TaxID=931276 RepID=M1N7T7_9CLOT|nr:sigma-70 family RNA polymerase sigma factor [Clostridium saccharoperbutylacetonicum]AGF59437.1 RNA polymerase sigma factor, sigma-70 family [Clostridium saccharoperbutylacetonicum N1-4(HMT)]NRT59770.1 RNA polymerase sigma factor (sigma-70 family) [Clostridium saccharoperbutylacetonicum]NSB23082.1 RNA polymerase sigma factor (sigma-70 family) [Clostridium saccharoperbutylacetonicum]NSB42453.1 RNA polymerase sigma factor (sigma-70 family) [Clostridium saccharoperbutylacetonicum]